jgi:hypothetical protein
MWVGCDARAAAWSQDLEYKEKKVVAVDAVLAVAALAGELFSFATLTIYLA